MNGLGRGPAPKTLAPPKTKNYDLTDIDERVSLIGDLIRKGSLDAVVQEATDKVLSKRCDPLGRTLKGAESKGAKWCVPEKDCLAEVKALFDYTRKTVRYRRDPVLADKFTGANRTLRIGAGDCDDYCITLGSMLMATGHPVRLRVVASRISGVPDAEAPWSHIYLLTPTKFDNPNAAWVSVDASMDKPLGWEAPGAKEVATNGKPAGMIARVRDYSVVKPTEMS